MFCSQCGAANPDEFKFCQDCGTALAKGIVQQQDTSPAPVARVASAVAVAPTSVSAAPRSAAAVTSQVRYGGFWIRLMAFIIDVIILNVIQWGVSNVTDLSLLPILAVSLLYFILLPPTLGATPGKLVLGYHVVDENGRHIGIGRAIVRYIGYVVSALAICLGFIWISFDARKQGWPDKIAGTFVVHK